MKSVHVDIRRVKAGVLTIATAAAVFLHGQVSAQSPAAGAAPMVPAPAAQSSAPQPDYHPSLGDLMTMAVQPRHLKLWLAGRQKNWSYAAYELSELRNAFGRVARTIPTYRTTDLASLFSALTNEPLDALDQAIRAADRDRFTAAYTRLTNACNACHLSQAHAMVVIRVPNENTYPDQDFAVPRR